MTTKAEKLARELISLSQSYSEKDFERAAALLETGELFSKVVAASRAAKAKSRKKVQPPRSPSERTNPSQAVANPVSNINDLEELIHQADGSERDRLLEFATKFQTGQALGSNKSARDFAYSIGVDLPKTMPKRHALSKRLITTLLQLSKDSRARIIDMALRPDDGESSLKRWSDLIVKP